MTTIHFVMGYIIGACVAVFFMYKHVQKKHKRDPSGYILRMEDGSTQVISFCSDPNCVPCNANRKMIRDFINDTNKNTTSNNLPTKG